jgi:hypothetical protein
VRLLGTGVVVALVRVWLQGAAVARPGVWTLTGSDHGKGNIDSALPPRYKDPGTVRSWKSTTLFSSLLLTATSFGSSTLNPALAAITNTSAFGTTFALYRATFVRIEQLPSKTSFGLLA